MTYEIVRVYNQWPIRYRVSVVPADEDFDALPRCIADAMTLRGAEKRARRYAKRRICRNYAVKTLEL